MFFGGLWAIQWGTPLAVGWGTGHTGHMARSAGGFFFSAKGANTLQTFGLWGVRRGSSARGAPVTQRCACDNAEQGCGLWRAALGHAQCTSPGRRAPGGQGAHQRAVQVPRGIPGDAAWGPGHRGGITSAARDAGCQGHVGAPWPWGVPWSWSLALCRRAIPGALATQPMRPVTLTCERPLAPRGPKPVPHMRGRVEGEGRHAPHLRLPPSPGRGLPHTCTSRGGGEQHPEPPPEL